MKKFYKLMLAGGLAIVIATSTFAQSAQQLKSERVNSSYMIALGRKPSSGELNYWTGRENLSLSQLVENHRQYLSGDKSSKRAMVIKSFFSSYGRNPTESEISTNMGQNMTYTEWMKNHLSWLNKSAASYEEVINNAYRKVMGRTAYANEIKYFRTQPVMSYMILAASLDNWKRSNGTAAKTSGSNTVGNSSSYLDVLKISDQVAREASSIIGHAGGNVIAAGGGNVISAGGGNVIAAGGGN